MDSITDEPTNTEGQAEQRTNLKSYLSDGWREFKVKGATPVKKLAGAIASAVTKDHEKIVLACIGASATNQAIKACVVAKRHLSSYALNLQIVPAFDNVEVEDIDALTALAEEPHTAVMMYLKVSRG